MADPIKPDAAKRGHDIPSKENVGEAKGADTVQGDFDFDLEPQNTYQTSQRPERFMVMQERQGNVMVIRLPGTDRMVHDRRQDHAERRDSSERPGRHDDHHQRAEGGHGRKGVRRGGAVEEEGGAGGPVKKVHAEGDVGEEGVQIRMAKFGDKDRLVSLFEKSLIGRFEDGENQAQEPEDGKFHFLKKTAAEWTGFFEKFLSRGMLKVVNWSEVQGFLFRGLLQEKGMTQKGIMISDIMTAAGTDKFARVPVALGKAQQLVLAAPGAVLTKDAVQEAALGNQLRYTALGALVAEEAAAAAPMARAASRGMFASQQLENRVAEQLGLVSDFRGAAMPGGLREAEEKRATEGRRRRGGMWSKFFGGDDGGGDGSVFVPWWRWDREERTGFRRWFVAVFGAVIFVILFFLIFALVRALKP